MIPLFTCKACGFLSTRADAFGVIQGVRFDKECIAKFEAGQDPVATWVREKLPEAENVAAACLSSSLAARSASGNEEEGCREDLGIGQSAMEVGQ